MGSFFTNVQVRAPRAARGRVLKTLRAIAADEGMSPAESGEAADRTFLVEAGGAWISVYDESTEDQSLERLDRLASALSARVETAAVAILVHDSDVLEMRLFDRGKCVDRFNSHPAYFGKVSAAEKRAAAGKPERWRPLLARRDAAELSAVWREEGLFAEDALARTAELLGIPRERVFVGYAYADACDLRYVALRFRHAVRPAYEAPAGGPPKLEMGGYCPHIEVDVGAPLTIGCGVRNGGGGARGVRVVAWGDALERGLVALDAVSLGVGTGEKTVRADAPLVDGASEDGKPLRVAVFEQTELPTGVPFSALASVPAQKRVDVMYASSLHAGVSGTGRAVGKGELHVGFAPIEAPDGAYSHTISVTVHARAGYRP